MVSGRVPVSDPTKSVSVSLPVYQPARGLLFPVFECLSGFLLRAYNQPSLFSLVGVHFVFLQSMFFFG